MTEERLNELARKLGTGPAERLDVAATARAVVERLREQPARRAIWVRVTWLRVAAALVILVGGAVTLRQIWPTAPDNQATHLVADDLSDLSTEDLRVLLTSLDQIMGDSVVSDSTSDLLELDAQQLRELLREG